MTETMTEKAKFSDADWAKVLSAPLLAGVAVTMAEPSGLFGMLKEGMASGSALLAARSDAAAGPLAREVAEEFENGASRARAREALQAEIGGKGPAELREAAVAALARIGALVDANAPQEAPAFKAWLRDLAEKVAESASEGGFLGFGGVKVSEAEKATVAELGKALGLPA